MIFNLNVEFPGKLHQVEISPTGLRILPGNSDERGKTIEFAKLSKVVYQKIIRSQYHEPRLQIKFESPGEKTWIWLTCEDTVEKEEFIAFWDELHQNLGPYKAKINFHKGQESRIGFYLLFSFLALLFAALLGTVLWAGIADIKGQRAAAFLLFPVIFVVAWYFLRLMVTLSKPGPYDPLSFKPIELSSGPKKGILP